VDVFVLGYVLFKGDHLCRVEGLGYGHSSDQ
jgi:hypothetical protein